MFKAKICRHVGLLHFFIAIGKYKAVAVHYHTVESRQLIKEVAQRMGTHTSNVLAVMTSVAEVVNNHLREGDRVRLEDWGMMKLEIESEKVDNLKVVV